MTLQQKAAALGEKEFLGVPVREFEMGGRIQLIALLKAGLSPHSKVVDIGCGVLRGGYWLIHFLAPSCYFGIEPRPDRLRTGLDHFLEPEVVAAKHPRFDTNPHFDTSVFGTKFDFFLARSVWTHASKPQIESMLDSFVRDSTPDGVFLTSYLSADDSHPDHRGLAWVGTSHESDVPGCIHHDFGWIEAQCDRRGLVAREWEQEVFNTQRWIEIRRRVGSAGSVS
ncbi:MAG: hypothetical protein U1F71_11495 [Verrucomicrobiaceae bacterium]